MTTHPKTTFSFASKSEQYLIEDCDGPPFAQHFAVTPLLGNISGKTVLCVGCGSGLECDVLTKMGGKVSAIDPSAELLSKARVLNPTVDFQLASAELLPFPDKSFDIVYCAHVLHYINDWAEPLREMLRVLKIDGRLIVTVHHPLDYGLIHQDERRVLGFDKDKEIGDYLTHREVHATWYKNFEVVYYPRNIADMLNSFIQAGFSVLSCSEAGSTAEGKIPIFLAFQLHRY